ncbi:hypothetical protein [Chryseobacterium joostei]|uniref:hypothetical protein n=1 Tax=Chryseobacterium joostei TaxID=112234 RepID=UPI003D102240
MEEGKGAWVGWREGGQMGRNGGICSHYIRWVMKDIPILYKEVDNNPSPTSPDDVFIF